MTQLVTIAADSVQTLVTAAGDHAAYRLLEFFTAQIRNSNTRSVDVRAVGAFPTWLEAPVAASVAVASPLHVMTHIEQLTCSDQSVSTDGSPPSLRQSVASRSGLHRSRNS